MKMTDMRIYKNMIFFNCIYVYYAKCETGNTHESIKIVVCRAYDVMRSRLGKLISISISAQQLIF